PDGRPGRAAPAGGGARSRARAARFPAYAGAAHGAGWRSTRRVSTAGRRAGGPGSAPAAGAGRLRARAPAGRDEHAAVSRALCRQALQLNPDSPAAYVGLGRALAAQGRVDEAVPAFDQAPAAASRAARSGASRAEIDKAREAADAAPLWKADALYNDGVKQL